MGDKLYIDKSCKICSAYGSYIYPKKSCAVQIRDIRELKGRKKTEDEIIFESNNKYYSGVDGIIKSMQVTNKSSLYIKLLIYTPKFLAKNIYKFISHNRYRISKLFTIIKPKS